MNDLALVSVVDGCAYPNKQAYALLDRGITVAKVDIQLPPARNVFHDEIGFGSASIVPGAGVIDLGDSRMMQLAEDLDFLLEATKHGRGKTRSLEHLQRHHALGLLLHGGVDHGHAAFAQHVDDPIAGDFRWQCV